MIFAFQSLHSPSRLFLSYLFVILDRFKFKIIIQSKRKGKKWNSFSCCHRPTGIRYCFFVTGKQFKNIDRPRIHVYLYVVVARSIIWLSFSWDSFHDTGDEVKVFSFFSVDSPFCCRCCCWFGQQANEPNEGLPGATERANKWMMTRERTGVSSILRILKSFPLLLLLLLPPPYLCFFVGF